MLFLEPGFVERLVILGAILLRLIIGLYSYSGEATPPKYGDFEAQRHWMEITTGLPVTEWYTDSLLNPRSWWPLDYPPLSGYQSWIHGKILQQYVPQQLELGKSRGSEGHDLKHLMRMTVVGSDLLIYFPAAILVTRKLYGSHATMRRAFALAVALLNPALIIIDHGHFQYNCISLGLSAAAVGAILSGWVLSGASLFTLAMCHKHMALYYAPAFFAHLLGRCLQRPTFFAKVRGVVALGITVILTLVAAFSPWLTSEKAFLQVLSRIFPVHRGLYEDYVANFWCASSVAIKWKDIFSTSLLMPLCLLATVLVCLPPMIQQIRVPSANGLLLCMANSGFAFFMFAFQVHEKNVLMPLMPLTLLAGVEVSAASWAPLIAMVSMYPLLERDHLSIPYAGLCAVWGMLMFAFSPMVAPPKAAKVADDSALFGGSDKGSRGARRGSRDMDLFEGPGPRQGWRPPSTTMAGMLFVAASICLHTAFEHIEPPEHLPWLWDRAFISLAFVGLAALAVYLQVAQWGANVSLNMAALNPAALQAGIGKKRA